MISTETTSTIPTDQERPRPRWRRLLVGLAVALPLGLTLAWAGTYAWNAWSAYAGYLKYEPQEGDVVFQSLPHGPVVWAIEGGPVPVDREMITPRDLAKARQLEPVFAHNIVIEKSATHARP